MSALLLPEHAAQGGDRTLDALVEGELMVQLDYFFRALIASRESFTLAGARVFDGKDPFLPGKICAGFAHLLIRDARQGAPLERRLAQFRAVMDFTAPLDIATWGMYYALTGLVSLQRANLLADAVSPATLTSLQAKCDWRRFVDPRHYTLIDLPTNYYGVAFSVARLRMLLGWEDAQASEALLQRMLAHYETHSGAFGFCDDTDGEGRFDRYSILLIAEICERFIETGLEVTPQLRQLLRKASDVALNLAHARGDGFCFGRSLGPYGDTAMLQILSVAGYLGVLDRDAQAVAYSLCVAVAERYITFWFDAASHSVDMWAQGRRVDAYRGKSRILGENLSLLHQIISANRLWGAAGFRGFAALDPAAVQAWLARTQPPCSLIEFARGDVDRALAIYRDQGRVFSLLMVNGGTGQHMNSPYYPLPFAAGVIEGIADSGCTHAQLMPKLTLQDGSPLLATTFFRAIHSEQRGDAYHVFYRLDCLNLQGADAPRADPRFAVDVETIFQAGTVRRIERYSAQHPVPVRAIELDFLSFSREATQEGTAVHWTSGAVRAFSVEGFDTCLATAVHDDARFRSPNGPMHTWVHCSRGPFVATEPFTLAWTLSLA